MLVKAVLTCSLMGIIPNCQLLKIMDLSLVYVHANWSQAIRFPSDALEVFHCPARETQLFVYPDEEHISNLKVLGVPYLAE